MQNISPYFLPFVILIIVVGILGVLGLVQFGPRALPRTHLYNRALAFLALTLTVGLVLLFSESEPTSTAGLIVSVISLLGFTIIVRMFRRKPSPPEQ